MRGEPLWLSVGELEVLFMVWQGLLQSFAPLAGGALALHFYHRRQSEEVQHWLRPIGRDGVRMALAFAALIWVLPGGTFLVLPLLLLLSVASPAARMEWGRHRTPRLMAVGVALLCTGLTGFAPVSEPIHPDSWGQPLFTENPNAPVYPASEQYTWFTNDVVILQSMTVRLPHQPGVFGAEWTAMTLASAFNMETSRMHQAIELLDEEVPFVRLNPDEVLLQPVAAPTKLEVRVAQDDVQTVEFRRYDVRSTSFGVNAEGTKVGDVVAVSLADWGGELDILVIVRPIGHPSLELDANGEPWIRTWLLART